ncbi:NYN domain-containing protein [Arthrospira platensis]|uniref:NYN domain-containing protein n=1 Tax=Limnospira platensis NIES-46 TaxID=1236695 RepID=A0A5M3TAQ8_LIMPL|nr:NYN domain-containing protein [Arthrospira platensis]AMW31300.1 hypothetical protein AP285_28645 [Arthrospira platensis YZ]KDR56084.1 hypothetical protein APPUASWS_018980 [Arthrospira platensis str. Paraca]MBD2708958.1 NYN domain-containing protein [Arthrospira platensis FACHB-835]QQW29187.1 NYN domain-containing protein [Arthrospira sp. PCC 9108]BAI94280.1 hypothetical protein NIES39_Q02720 [Arthrospira platensis NIES-39]GCE95050.1 hypothetical protein NIES46_31110 [Arthrospira platensis 
MPHQSLVPQTNNGTTAVSQISNLIYQTVVSFQQQHPECLNVRYQGISWEQPQYQTKLLAKLNQGLGQAPNPEALLSRVRSYLKSLLNSEAIATNIFNQLKPQLQQLLNAEINEHLNTSIPNFNGHGMMDNGASILLLDAENIQLDADAEKFLEKICHYPLQIRVAFANWRSLGKKDAEFHQRGYQLIHVPAGKDSADLKMATVGSSIFVHYPTAREVLVCSSDQALIHLCNTLQSHGLTVYHVRKTQDQIVVFNSQNGTTQKYSLSSSKKVIPKVEELLEQLQELILLEQQRSNCYWIKLTKISTLYHNQYKLTLTQVISEHFVDFKVQDIFIKNPLIFAVHKISEQSQIYVTLFNENLTISTDNVSLQAVDATTPTTAPTTIKSSDDLEKALVSILKELTKKSPNSPVHISILASHFMTKYHVPINQLLSQFNDSKKFPKFLESCGSFHLKQTPKGWEVGLLNPH